MDCTTPQPEQHPQVGQTFIPFRLFRGAFLPNVILRYPGLSPSAKLLWARLAQYAGENGKCYPSQVTLAEELGITDRHIRKLLTELEDKGFVVGERTPSQRLIGANARYRFLWHEVFNDAPEEKPTIPELEFLSDRNDCSSPDRNDCSGPIKEISIEENQKKEQTKSVRDLQEEELDRQARGVFDYWVRVMGMGRGTEFESCGRDTKVKARLRKGFSAADLRQAIMGCRESPFHMGENPSGAIHNDLELICRDDKHVRYFTSIAEKAQTTSAVGRIREIRRVMQEVNEGAARALAQQYGIDWDRVVAPADLQLITGGYE